MSGIPRNMSYASLKSAKYRNPNGASKYFDFYKKHNKFLEEIIEREGKNYADEYLKNGIIKPTLNSEIWENNKIKPEIRKNLINLAKEFWKFLGIDVKPKGLIVTGSIANYNWNNKSDIDLHLVFDYNAIDDDQDFVLEFMKTKKDLWKEKHDIKIKDFDVEIFGQDENQEPKKHSSSYDLIKNDWILEPKKVELNLDKKRIKDLTFGIIKKIYDVFEETNEQKQIEKSDAVWDIISNIRQKGLNRNGEYGEENIVFKILRNYGFLEKLDKVKDAAIDDIYTINESLQQPDKNEIKSQVDNIIKKAIQNRLFGENNSNEDDFLKLEFPTKKFDGHKYDEYYYSLDKDKSYKAVDEELAETQPLNQLFIKNDLDLPEDKVECIKDFISFVCDKLNMKEGTKVYLRNGRDEYIVTTASYVPSENSNHVRCGNRAIIDILRSIAHEMVHNRQREIGIFNPEDDVQNIGGFIEDQANSVAGIFIKDFTHNYGYDSVYDF